jgi:hypothetical protein
MERRILSREEMTRIQKAIAFKDLTSAEILIEVYDHYVSHLESFEELDFEAQLFELEQKFRYSYYNVLQENFAKTSKKELQQLQYSIWKSYFTWPPFIGTLLVLVFLTVLWSSLEGKARGLPVVISMIPLLLTFCWILVKSKIKVNKIKRAIGLTSKIQSSYLTNIIIQYSLLSGLLNGFIQLPRLFSSDEGFFESYYFIFITFLLCVFFIIYTLTLFEAWKIKSKTALI